MMFQCFVRYGIDGEQYLDMEMVQRSVDLFLGEPFNIASYALLTHMLAQVLGMKAGVLSITMGDYHIYLPNHESGFEGHLKQCELQMSRDALPARAKLILPPCTDIDGFLPAYMTDRNCIRVEDYRHHPFIPAKMSY
jgi:thymidylate synthase